MSEPSDFWFSPEYILSPIRRFLGNDYYDPCPINPKFDGLQATWGENTYINAPYSKVLKRAFVNKGLAEYKGGRYLWLFNYANSKDLAAIHSKASAVCIPYERVKFVPGHPSLTGHPENPDPKKRGKCSPMYDNIFILWGDTRGFRSAFIDIGYVYNE